MKNYSFALTVILALLFGGCYTQLGTVKKERVQKPDYTYEEEPYREESQDTAEDEQYDTRSYDGRFYYDGYRWYPRYRSYFSYYYPAAYWPSVAFRIAYYDPWYYDCYWYYDPWICGTPYVWYGWPVVYPAYPYYVYPYWRYRYYTWDGSPVRRTNRDFGSTRGGGSGRTIGGTRTEPSSGFEMPISGSIEGRSAAGGRSEGSSVSSPSRTGKSRTDAPRVRRSRTGRGEAPARGGTRRDTPNKDRRGEAVTPPSEAPNPRAPAVQPAAGDDSKPAVKEQSRPDQDAPSARPSGSRRGSGSQVAPQSSPPPPPSHAPSSSSPPPQGGQSSGGGRSGGNSGDSGGGRSGGRR